MAQPAINLSRNRIYHILELTDPADKTSSIISFAIVGLIFINVLAIVLESISWIYERYESAFLILEILSCSIFAVEYSFCSLAWICASSGPSD
jgi:voltage-gated potassium channel